MLVYLGQNGFYCYVKLKEPVKKKKVDFGYQYEKKINLTLFHT